jgi:hypothetical protein
MSVGLDLLYRSVSPAPIINNSTSLMKSRSFELLREYPAFFRTYDDFKMVYNVAYPGEKMPARTTFLSYKAELRRRFSRVTVDKKRGKNVPFTPPKPKGCEKPVINEYYWKNKVDLIDAFPADEIIQHVPESDTE